MPGAACTPGWSRLYARLKAERDEAAGRHGNTVAELQRAVQEHWAATDARTRAALAERIKRLTGLAERQRAAITATEAEMARVKAAYEDWAKHLPTAS